MKTSNLAKTGTFNNKLLDSPKEQKIFRNRIEEINSQEKGGFTFGLGGWLGGSDTSAEEREKIQQEIDALKHELQLKIEENEQVHISMFERKTDFNKQIDQYKEDIAEMEKNRQMKEIQYQNLVQSKDSLSTEMNSIKEEKRQLNMQ